MDNCYEGYELNCGIYDYMLSDEDTKVLNIGIWIVDNKCSIRQCAKEFMISKSTVHRRIHNELPNICDELYGCVTKQLRCNSECRRKWH